MCSAKHLLHACRHPPSASRSGHQNPAQLLITVAPSNAAHATKETTTAITTGIRATCSMTHMFCTRTTRLLPRKKRMSVMLLATILAALAFALALTTTPVITGIAVAQSAGVQLKPQIAPDLLIRSGSDGDKHGPAQTIHPRSSYARSRPRMLSAVSTSGLSRNLRLRPRIYSSGAILAYGGAPLYGSLSNLTLNSPVAAMAVTPNGGGYWLAAADGGVFAFGDAKFYGSAGSIRLYAPVVGIAATPDGGGYWLAALDGGVFAFGNAKFYGSMGGKPLNQPVVGIAATPDGHGYWLVAADGGIFAFGDAQFLGSGVSRSLSAPVTGITPTASGKGYWLVEADGGVATFGDAHYWGSAANDSLSTPVVGMAATANDGGYWLATANGSVIAFGDAKFFGSNGAAVPAPPVAAIAAAPSGGYYLLEPDGINYSFADPSPTSFPGSSQIVEAAASQVTADPDTGQGPFCNPYGPCEEWCALFATWVWRDAGIPIPSYAFTGDVYYWAASYGAVLTPTSEPSPGDAVLYGTGPATVSTSVHMGIVAQVWPDGAIITIEGDAGPSPVGYLSVIINGPYLPWDSAVYNGFPVYAFAQPVQ